MKLGIKLTSPQKKVPSKSPALIELPLEALCLSTVKTNFKYLNFISTHVKIKTNFLLGVCSFFHWVN